MADKRACENCGAALPANAPQGVCPRCLASAGLGLMPEAGEAPTVESPQGTTGGQIGAYKLLQKIGEGGCGTVYMAEQEQPVRRRVALKVIKLGMDTRNVIARFEAERQALALMDHPNIAKVLDAGATDHGRPYFVMELVRGIKITEYCDQNNLSTEERLKLFVQVCQAIQHAHQKGIIHRDIKPSNILVTLHDGVPVPKVIDFGIAKATTDQRLTDKTLFTAFEQFIGTPAYMSPEQAEMSGLDIDTRSDIYALGVLLYELLTGKTPFDSAELAASGLDAMRRTIREKEPARPSTRLGTLVAEELSTTAKRRQCEGPKLVALVRGDLDWIVMKCLEKDRTRRYETANGLALEVQRHLADEPVLARPPSRVYQFQKLVKRNRLLCAAAGTGTVTLALGLGLSTWMFVQERAARQRAVKAEQAQGQARQEAERLGKEAQANERRAKSEAVKSQQVAQFLQDMLKRVTPEMAKGRNTELLREVLDETAARVGDDLKDQPLVEAELRATLGKVYHSLGIYTNASQMMRRAIGLRQAGVGKEDKLVAQWLMDLGNSLAELDELTQAEEALSDALGLAQRLYGEVSTNTATVWAALGSLAWSEQDFTQAIQRQHRALTVLMQLLDDDSPQVAWAHQDLGVYLEYSGDLAGAETNVLKALAIRREKLPEKHPDLGESLHQLGSIRWGQGRLEEAESLNRQALALAEAVQGEQHQAVARSCNNLALVLRDRDKLDVAEPLQRRAWDLAKRSLGAGHQHEVEVRKNVATVIRRRSARVGDLNGLRESLWLNPVDPLTVEALQTALSRPALSPLWPQDTAQPPHWLYTSALPGKNWAALGFDSANWSSDPPPMASASFIPRRPRISLPNHRALWLRAEFDLAAVPAGMLVLLVNRNQDAQVFINGVRAAPTLDWSDIQIAASCSDAASAALKPGRNVLALFCEDADDGVRIDVRLCACSDPQLGQKMVLEELDGLIQKEPQRADLYAGRANVLGRAGHWPEAAQDLARAVELKPLDPTYSARLGVVLLQTGDEAGYGRHRRATLEGFAHAKSQRSEEQVARSCLLAPLAGEELTAAGRLADAAGEASYVADGLPWRQLAKSLAEYRRGRFADAVVWAQKAVNASAKKELPLWSHERERNCGVAARLVLGMAQHQLNQPMMARTTLAEARTLAHEEMPLPERGDLGRDWPDWLMAQILLREATALIGGGAQ